MDEPNLETTETTPFIIWFDDSGILEVSSEFAEQIIELGSGFIDEMNIIMRQDLQGTFHEIVIGSLTSWKENIGLDVFETDSDLRIYIINIFYRIAYVSGFALVYGIDRSDVKIINIVLIGEDRF